MAILIGGILGGKISGKLGGNVYTVRNGKTYVRAATTRTKPATEAMKGHQQLFSKAGTLNSVLQGEIKKHITFNDPAEMNGKIMSGLVQWLGEHSRRRVAAGNQQNAFYRCLSTKSSFNAEKWKRHLMFSWSPEGTMRITIPSFMPREFLMGHPQTDVVTCKIVSVGLMPGTGILTGSCTQEISFDYEFRTVAEREAKMRLPAVKGSLITTTMSLEFNVWRSGVSLDGKYMPAGIMNAWYV